MLEGRIWEVCLFCLPMSLFCLFPVHFCQFISHFSTEENGHNSFGQIWGATKKKSKPRTLQYFHVPCGFQEWSAPIQYTTHTAGHDYSVNGNIALLNVGKLAKTNKCQS